MIAIIDYGAGNIQSVNKALKYIGCDCVVTRDKDMILKADGAVLPGVGSFGDTMDTMESYGIKDTVLDFIKTKKHFLGICLGLQLLFPESEESPNKKGLSVFDGSIKENLVFDTHVPEEQIWNALREVQLSYFVEKLASGLDTQIGEKGTCLSGGEKQRLA